jgi:hypothetical protein
MIIDQDDKWFYCLCERCGLKYSVTSRRVKNVDFCSSCRATPLKQVTYGNNGYCIPWHGDFDEWENPVLNGRLYKAGVRSCGHRDCVRDVHITPVAFSD